MSDDLEQIIGFDVRKWPPCSLRELGMAVPPVGSSRDEPIACLSIGEEIWGRCIRDRSLTVTVLLEGRAPPFHDLCVPLFGSVSDVHAELALHGWRDEAAYVLIGVSRRIETGRILEWREHDPATGRPRSTTGFPALPSGWERLGYDVCDDSLISGLYGELLSENGATPKPGDLNEFCLFQDAQSALQFVPVCNAGGPTHAPFNVFALYGPPEIRRRLEEGGGY